MRRCQPDELRRLRDAGAQCRARLHQCIRLVTIYAPFLVDERRDESVRTIGANSVNQPSMTPKTNVPDAPALRFDIVAGLTAAAVVLPKAMAYATVAGLPVAVGLYTSFVPMVIYALLGSSRVLSVSSTATLAILVGTQLGLVVPDGDPVKLVDGDGHAGGPGRRDAGPGEAAEAGVRGELHFRTGPDGLQGGHRPRDRAGPGAETPRNPHHEAGVLSRISSALCTTFPKLRS